MSQVLVDAGVGSAGVVLPTLTAGYDAAWLGWNEAWRENRQFTGVDAAHRRVLVNYLGRPDVPYAYDYLILAPGAAHSYFGHHEFAPFAPGMKSIADAEAVRATVLKAFETAEIEEDPAKHQDLLTFVLVGGGPTGVEMAGALADHALPHRIYFDYGRKRGLKCNRKKSNE